MRLQIAGITEDGLNLNDGSASWAEPWEAVSDIQAARVPDGQGSVLVLVVGIRDERSIIMAEGDPLWNDLGTAIYSRLPGSLPSSIWKDRLENLGKLAIYNSASTTAN